MPFYAGEERTFTGHPYNLIKGAQYLSIPYLPANTDPKTIFGPEVNVWRYDTITDSWGTVSNVNCKEGYYVYAPVAKTVTVTGVDCIVTLDDLIAIYNVLEIGQYALVGPGNADINVVGTVLEGKIQGYIGAGEWEYTNFLTVGKGYWVGKEIHVFQKAVVISTAGFLGYVRKREVTEKTTFGAKVDKLTIATLFVNAGKAELSIAGEKVGEVEAKYNAIETKTIDLGEIPTEGKDLEIELKCIHVIGSGAKYAACATVVGVKKI